jgi:LmbE family N-acetylglucosaminyl deacetylase
VAAALKGDDWQDKVVPLEEAEMAAKIAAIACYSSQISTFFSGLDEMAQRLRAYAASVGRKKGWAERYWRRGQDK